MISNCGHDSRGKYSGDTAGDQSGTEWYIRTWYPGGWIAVFRHPDAKVRSMLASMAEAAARNDNVGYDQSERLTFWNQLQKVGYDPSKISVKCEADCSSGVGAIVKGAGYRLGMTTLQNVNPSIYTGNESAALVAAGFSKMTDSKYRTSDKYLLAGDILLSSGHTTASPSDRLALTAHSAQIPTRRLERSNQQRAWMLTASLAPRRRRRFTDLEPRLPFWQQADSPREPIRRALTICE